MNRLSRIFVLLLAVHTAITVTDQSEQIVFDIPGAAQEGKWYTFSSPIKHVAVIGAGTLGFPFHSLKAIS